MPKTESNEKAIADEIEERVRVNFDKVAYYRSGREYEDGIYFSESL